MKNRKLSTVFGILCHCDSSPRAAGCAWLTQSLFLFIPVCCSAAGTWLSGPWSRSPWTCSSCTCQETPSPSSPSWWSAWWPGGPFRRSCPCLPVSMLHYTFTSIWRLCQSFDTLYSCLGSPASQPSSCWRAPVSSGSRASSIWSVTSWARRWRSTSVSRWDCSQHTRPIGWLS